MGVVWLRRTLPETLHAGMMCDLRLNGAPPCRDGLARALEWIGERVIPLDEALEQLPAAIGPDDALWACRALGVAGYGVGNGYGDGYGYGYGYGDGYGYGYGNGYGDGYGYGYGYGNGDGNGDGYGIGNGNGYGGD